MNFRRMRVERPQPPEDVDVPVAAPAPALSCGSLLDRAAAAAPLAGTAAERRDNALVRTAAFADRFGAGGFSVVERAGFWAVSAPELESLAMRCGVKFLLRGGSSPADEPVIILGSAEIDSLEMLGSLTRPMVALAELRESLTSTDATVSTVEVSSTSVHLKVNGATVTVDDDGLVAAVGPKGPKRRSTRVSSPAQLVKVAAA